MRMINWSKLILLMKFKLWTSQSFQIRVFHSKPYKSTWCKVQSSPNCPLTWWNTLFHLKMKIHGIYPWINVLLIFTAKWLWRLNLDRFSLYRYLYNLQRRRLLHLWLCTCLFLGRGNSLFQSIDLPWDQRLLFIELHLHPLCWGCFLQPVLSLCMQCSL